MICLILEKVKDQQFAKVKHLFFSVRQVSQCLHLVSWTGRLLASDLFLFASWPGQR